MVESGLLLLRRQGYAETSWRALVQESQTPFGSIQHFFPGGKDQLVAEALALFVDRLCGALDRTQQRGLTPGATVEAFFLGVAEAFEQDNCALGCPLAAVALEVSPQQGAASEACASEFARLARHVEAVLADLGVEEASLWADRVLVGIEGGLMVGRLRRSGAPLRDTGRGLASQLSSGSSPGTQG